MQSRRGKHEQRARQCPAVRAAMRAAMSAARRQRGAITVTGALVVLMLFALALAAALSYAKALEDRSEIQMGVSGLLTVKHNVENAYRNRDSYAGLTPDSAVVDGLVPTLLQGPSAVSTMFNGWNERLLPDGSAWVIVGYPYTDPHPTRIVLAVYTDDPAACVAYAQGMADGAYQLFAGSMLVGSQAIGPSVDPPLVGGALYSQIASSCEVVSESGFLNGYVFALY